MTLSSCGNIRYTANAKPPAFYVAGGFTLWHRCSNRSLISLNRAKKPLNNSPGNTEWRPAFAASNNFMNQCVHNRSAEFESANAGTSRPRTAAVRIH
jgi:hypothetical protein